MYGTKCIDFVVQSPFVSGACHNLESIDCLVAAASTGGSCSVPSYYSRWCLVGRTLQVIDIEVLAVLINVIRVADDLVPALLFLSVWCSL